LSRRMPSATSRPRLHVRMLSRACCGRRNQPIGRLDRALNGTRGRRVAT
jgi:hypothetical protein